MTVDQFRIDAFASCTGDHQWIHVDVERAKRESPYGGPIAHGYLTLAMIAPLAMQIGEKGYHAERFEGAPYPVTGS